MNTTTKWLIGIGVVLLLAVMFFLPFLGSTFSPTPYGYGMMGGRGMMGNYGFSPMMGFGFGLMWLIPLGLIVLIGLAIAALIKYLRAP